MITTADCGLVCGAEDEAAFAGMLKRFIQNPGDFARMAENGRGYYLQHFTQQKVLDQLEQILTQTVKGEQV